MNLTSYLHRIGCFTRPDTSLNSLSVLHYRHLLSVPLENLAIQTGIPIQLTIDALFQKIVSQRRGGICYELNGLFCALLKALGFAVKQVSARTYLAGRGFNPEFDHLALIVRIDQMDYLVDVGLGRRFPLYPLRLVVDQLHQDRTGVYQITQPTEDIYILHQRSESELWEAVYRFTLTARELVDFEPMCAYHQSSPDSFFTQNTVCTLVTDTGRMTLTDRQMKWTTDKESIEQAITSAQLFTDLLSANFGLQPY